MQEIFEENTDKYSELAVVKELVIADNLGIQAVPQLPLQTCLSLYPLTKIHFIDKKVKVFSFINPELFSIPHFKKKILSVSDHFFFSFRANPEF